MVDFINCHCLVFSELRARFFLFLKKLIQVIIGAHVNDACR